MCPGLDTNARNHMSESSQNGRLVLTVIMKLKLNILYFIWSKHSKQIICPLFENAFIITFYSKMLHN